MCVAKNQSNNILKLGDEIISIDAIIASYDVNFELSIEGDEISGAMMGMFDVEGSRVQPQ